ncbi:hypothetical protein Pcinc_007188 [Petrolisthes cinctipes]|uniref:Uncharacterized protein n=1 Tax=Petrolisthes cinctipes TaxID=88211 RepID=A0AAE1KX67_PETCI|nr:hypothetical protein Pcinc_007188 [Petrolisthes cinctipes]
MRSSFRKEMKKVENSKKSGAATDEVYVQVCGTTNSCYFFMTKKGQGHQHQILKSSLSHTTFPIAGREYTDLISLRSQAACVMYWYGLVRPATEAPPPTRDLKAATAREWGGLTEKI